MKDSHSTKFERKPQTLVKIGFIELCDSKLSGLRLFDDMAISLPLKGIRNHKTINVGCDFMRHQSLK